VPLGVIAMLVMFALIMRRAHNDLSPATGGVPLPAR